MYECKDILNCINYEMKYTTCNLLWKLYSYCNFSKNIYLCQLTGIFNIKPTQLSIYINIQVNYSF